MEKIVVDTNIVFSGILNTDSKIGDLLMNSGSSLEFYSVAYLRLEIEKHKDKIIEISGLAEAQIEESKFQITKSINFISEEQIPFEVWTKAANFVRDVDMDDIAFVALSEFMKIRLWTGDKKLMNGLISKGFQNCISTEDLLNIRAEFEK